MTTGDIVLLRRPMLGEEQHSVGVVFYDYTEGVQVIFMDGGYDGFSSQEQTDFLLLVGHDEQSTLYQFKNVMQVSFDYQEGMWNHVFKNQRYRRDRGF
jgi:hypothetical protein